MQSRNAYQPGVHKEDLAIIMMHTPVEVWQALQDRKVFITGGTGFVGCWLLEALLWANESLGLDLKLTVLTRHPDAFHKKAPHLAGHSVVRLLEGDVTNLSAIDDPFDVILHAATDVINSSKNPLDVFNNIVQGTVQTLDLAKRCGAQRYLLTSSGAVYGPQPPNLTHLPEIYAGAPSTSQPGSAYGEGKRVSEWLLACARQQTGLQAQIARCFAFVGPYMALDAHFAIGNFIRDAAKCEAVQVSGDGTPYRSYMYAADLSVWLLTILVAGDQQAYNVGSSKEINIAQLAQEISETLIGRTLVNIATTPILGKPANYYVPNNERALALGLGEYTCLKTAIIRTAAWHRNNRPGQS